MDSNSERTDDDGIDAPTTRGAPEDDWTYVAQAHYDPDESLELATVIIGAIADAEDVPLTEIKNPPLYEVVDSAAVESALFGRPNANRNATDSTVEFRYNEYKIRVDADGWVTVSTRPGGQ